MTHVGAHSATSGDSDDRFLERQLTTSFMVIPGQVSLQYEASVVFYDPVQNKELV